MARPLKTRGLSPGLDASKAAALSLETHLLQLSDQLVLASAGNIEGIHDARVASKRLREVLRFARGWAPKEAYSLALHPIQTLNDGLGPIRDRDVMKSHLAELVASHPDLKRALKGLDVALREERNAALCRLLEALPSAEQELSPRIHSLCRLLRKVKEAPSLKSAIRRQLSKRLLRLFDGLDLTLLEADAVAFHERRILAKRVKYTLEPWLPVLSAAAGRLRDEVAELQELMGLARDWEVLRARLEERAKAARTNQAALFMAASEADARRRDYTTQALVVLRRLAEGALAAEVREHLT